MIGPGQAFAPFPGQSLTAVPPARGTRAPASVRDAQLDPKLVAAAHQFEASMMAELLKPLSSGELFGEDEEGAAAAGTGGVSDLTSSGDGSGGALMSFGSEALAKAISEKGGLGIARRVLDQFEAAAEKKATPAGLNGNPAADQTGNQAGKPGDKKIHYGPAIITKVM